MRALARATVGVLGLACVAAGVGCSGKGDDDDEDLGGVPDLSAMTDEMRADTEQTPPVGRTALGAWLAQGHYEAWTCEEAAHPARPFGAHGVNRICENDAMAAHREAGEYPIGAASVKELYDGGGAVIGYAVSLKTGSGGGEAWYWYEQNGNGVVADGSGASGVAQTVCVSCHAAAGASADRSGHDLVYTQLDGGGAPAQGDMSEAMMHDSAQTPPMGHDALEAWLATGAYKRWACEAAPHAPRAFGAHRFNRICSNALQAGHGTGAYPVGAAAVKELYDRDAGGPVVGYAVMLKVSAGAGDSVYWYERAGDSVAADGLGTMGTAKGICVRCHSLAGTDGREGHDLFYSQVP